MVKDALDRIGQIDGGSTDGTVELLKMSHSGLLAIMNYCCVS